MHHKLKQCGIGLLELMLSLTVIALLLLAATRYYVLVRSSEQTNEAVAMLTAVIGAVDQWRWTYKDNPNATINLKDLIDQGLLPQKFDEIHANPWGGVLTINNDTSGAAKITLTDVPNGICVNLKDMMEEHKMEGNCQGTTFSAIYPSTISHIHFPT